MRYVFSAIVAASVLVSCGGGGGGGKPASVTQPPVQPDPAEIEPMVPTLADYYAEYHDHAAYYDPGSGSLEPNRPPLHSYNSLRLPSPQHKDADHQPVYYDGGSRTSLGWIPTLYAGVVPDWASVDELPEVGQRNGFTIHHGKVDAGAGRTAIVNYLNAASNGTGLVHRYVEAPTLMVVGVSTDEERRVINEAVRLINGTLPVGSRIRVETPSSDNSMLGRVDTNGRYFTSGRELPGTIHVEFVPCEQYHHGCGTVVGTAWTTDDSEGDPAHSYVRLNRTRLGELQSQFQPGGGSAVAAAVHEIVHTLGVRGHVGRYIDPRSAYGYQSLMLTTYYSSSAPASLLYPIDREALRALHTLSPGDSVTSFGPWSSEMRHLSGKMVHTQFGVMLSNGYVEPWAAGLAPIGDLADNRELTSSATWSGVLLGFTPDEDSVAGDAAITVDLTAMTGSAAFTELEMWAANAVPGEKGSGTTWLDGDLGYVIVISGNTFRETGGDDGILTGIFTGPAHEGAAGTLERADLTAAFGAAR